MKKQICEFSTSRWFYYKEICYDARYMNVKVVTIIYGKTYFKSNICKILRLIFLYLSQFKPLFIFFYFVFLKSSNIYFCVVWRSLSSLGLYICFLLIFLVYIVF
jgi:hypothetical protein